MLHIILVILKIAGILLAVVLLLILLAILLLLFVPLRYELDAKRNQEETWGKGRVTWLFHLVSVRASYELSKGPEILVKVLWFPLLKKPEESEAAKETQKKRKRPKKKSPAKKESRSSKGKPPEPMGEPEKTEKTPLITEPETPLSIAPERMEPPKSASTPDRTEPSESASTPDRTEPPESASIPERTEPMQSISAPEEPAGAPAETGNPKPPGRPPEELPVHGEAEPEGTEGSKKSLMKKILEFFKGLFGKIKRIFEGLKRAFRNIRDKIRHLQKTISDIRKRITHYLDIWNEEETKALRKALIGHVRYLIRHMRPRKIKGYLRYGFADPSVTGELTGALYFIKPLAFADFQLLPEFETDSLILEGEVHMKGHIRPVHAVIIGLKLFFDKNLKHVLRRIRE